MTFGMSGLDSILNLGSLLRSSGQASASGTSASATNFSFAALEQGTSSQSSSNASSMSAICGRGSSNALSADMMKTLFAMQSASSSSTSGSSESKPKSPLEELFALLDSNSDGQISKSEFETALGQNGNMALADDVFSKMDKNGDGSVGLDEMQAALKGRGHHHHHHGGMNGGLEQALQGASAQTATNADGSTSTTITYADGSTVTMTQPASATASTGSSTAGAASTATSAYNFVEQLISREAQYLMGNNAASGANAIASGVSAATSVKV